VQESSDPEGLRVFYYLVQDLKALVFSLISLHFKVSLTIPLTWIRYCRTYTVLRADQAHLDLVRLFRDGVGRIAFPASESTTIEILADMLVGSGVQNHLGVGLPSNCHLSRRLVNQARRMMHRFQRHRSLYCSVEANASDSAKLRAISQMQTIQTPIYESHDE
jgi:hypothetical protein